MLFRSPLPAGVTVENNEVPAGSGRVEVRLKAAKDAKPGDHVLGVRAGEASSPWIEFKINPAAEEKK